METKDNSTNGHQLPAGAARRRGGGQQGRRMQDGWRLSLLAGAFHSHWNAVGFRAKERLTVSQGSLDEAQAAEGRQGTHTHTHWETEGGESTHLHP